MNFQQLLKQAQKMQKEVNKKRNDFYTKSFDIESQNNLITGKINGKLELTELHIDETLLKDKAMLEDLLTVTMNQMIAKISKEREDTVETATNGVDVSAFL